MAGFVVGRIASSVVAFLALTLFVFVALYAAPRSQGRFARRAPVEYRIHGSVAGEYTHYLWRLVRHADLGRSYETREAVSARLVRAAPVTASLVVGGLVVWLLISVPLGLLAAARPRSKLDRGATVLVLVGLSAHPLWLGLVLSYFFGHTLSILPAEGYCSVGNLSTGCDGLGRWVTHLILPWCTFGLVNAALFTLMIRSLVLDELGADYVRTAIAKGAGSFRIVRAHVLRNVTVPLVTMLGVQAATSLAGVVFIESAFDLPGLGGMLRTSAQRGDLPLTIGSVVFLALAVMVLNLLVDVSYLFVDPRLRGSARGEAPE
ncbi:MAG TPA: ABC transporter permease [Gaiellaceae bacterium]